MRPLNVTTRIITGIRAVPLTTAGVVIVLLLLVSCGTLSPDSGATNQASPGQESAVVERPSDSTRAIYECVRAAGWTDVEYDETSGTFGGNVPEPQQDKYFADAERCSTEVGELSRFAHPSDEQIRARYAAEVELRDCLIAEGYQISEPPSEATWVEAFGGSSPSLWLPYFEVYTQTGLSGEEEAQLKQRCPDPAESTFG